MGISGCIWKATAPQVETARKVILANGVAGNGGPYVPPVLSEGLPRRFMLTPRTLSISRRCAANR